MSQPSQVVEQRVFVGNPLRVLIRQAGGWAGPEPTEHAIPNGAGGADT